MKTFYDIIREVSNMRWSIVDPEPKSFSEVEFFIKQAIQQAHSYIWSLDDFPFKEAVEIILLPKEKSSVAAPVGIVKNVMLCGESFYLNSEENPDFLKIKKGKPECYWVSCSNQGNVLNFSPVPDKAYEVQIRYDMLCKACDKEGNRKANLENLDDVVNIAPEYEEIYLNCLKNKAMCYLIADGSDENYLPYQKQFAEQYSVLKQLRGQKINPYLVI